MNKKLLLAILICLITISAKAQSAITGTLYVCSSSTTTLSSSVSGGSWTSGNTSIATIGSASGIVTGIASGTSIITYTHAEGATYATVTVDPIPAAIGGEVFHVCEGSRITLTNSVPGGIWSSSNINRGTIDAISGQLWGKPQNSYVTMLPFDIEYTLCGNHVTQNVTLNALVELTYDRVFCVGQTDTIKADSSGGIWSIGIHSGLGTMESISDNTALFTATRPGTLKINYTRASTPGCLSDATETDTIFILDSTNTILGANPICVGIVELYTTIHPSIYGTWSSSNTAVLNGYAAEAINCNFTGVSAGTATISFQPNHTDCIVTKEVTVNPTPGVITGPSALVIGHTIQLYNSTTGGTWSSSNTSVATVGSSGIVTGISSGTTTITYILSGGCYVTKQLTVEPVFEIEVCEIDPIEICDTVFSYCDSFKLKVSRLSGSSAVDSFRWSPSLPAYAVFSGSEVTYVFTAVPTSGTYTVTAYLGSYTTSTRIRLVVASGGNYPCKQFKPLCNSDCDVVPFKTIWSTSLTNTHISETTPYNYYLPYRGGLSYSLEVSPAPGSVFLAAQYVDMVVETGKDITIDSCHLFSDVATGWWGIKVRVTSAGTGKLRVTNNTLIENVNRAGFGAVEIYPGTLGVSYPSSGEILESNTAIWNHNNIGINITDINTLSGRPPFTVVNSVFTNRVLCGYHTPGSTACGSYYPLAWPTVAYLKTMTFDTMTPQHIIDSFTEYTSGSVGIMLKRVSKTTGSAPYTYNYMILGHPDNDAMANMFDNLSDGVKVFTSNIIFYNNIFRKSLEGIDVQNYNEPFSILLSNGTTSNTNNRFFNCVNGVSTGGIYHFRSRNTVMRSEYYSSNTNPYVYAAPGYYGFNIINSSTSGFDTIDIDSNSISNYLYGVFVNLPTSTTICNGDVFIRNNTLKGITASDQYQYANTGILLLGTGTCATSTGTVKVTKNHIVGMVNGITATSKNHLTHIDSNEVVLLNNSSQNNRIGIRVIKGNTSIRSARIATINANHIYGDTANGVNYRTPATTIETNGNVITGYKGIEVSLAGKSDYSNTISCNYIHDLNIAFSFLDSSYLSWKKNVIERAEYGLLLQRYNLQYGAPVPASIGVQGSPCNPSDNLWVTGSAAVGGWSGWGGVVGTDTAWHTYVNGMDPAVMNCTLHVRNAPGYAPVYNGKRNNGSHAGIAYTFGTSLDSTACDTEIGTATICGPYSTGTYGERKSNTHQPIDGMTSEEQKNIFFTLYPNPSNGNIEIKHNTATDGNVAITVRSYTGAIVYAGELKMNNGISHMVLNNVAAGLYMVVVRDEEGHTNAFRLVIQ